MTKVSFEDLRRAMDDVSTAQEKYDEMVANSHSYTFSREKFKNSDRPILRDLCKNIENRMGLVRIFAARSKIDLLKYVVDMEPRITPEQFYENLDLDDVVCWDLEVIKILIRAGLDFVKYCEVYFEGFFANSQDVFRFVFNDEKFSIDDLRVKVSRKE